MAPERKENKKSIFKDLEIFGSIGIELVIFVILGVLGGNWLDKRFNTSPFLLITGAVFGATIGFYNFYRMIKTLSEQENQEKR